jgi:DNA ligase-1
MTMLLADLVHTAGTVAATSSRTAKRDAVAALLRGLAPDEIGPAVGFLMADPGQGRVGVGWATVGGTTEVAPASAPTLSILDIDHLLDALAATTGAGSTAARTQLLRDVFAAATQPEADFLRRLLLGDLRQGANEGVMADAVAAAAEVPASVVRRSMMLSGDLRTTARVALTEGRAGLERIGLTVLRPVQPMLASTAEDVGAAIMASAGGGGQDASALTSVEWKLDGARIQIHRRGDEVRVYTRNLNDVTARLPEVVTVARGLPATDLVLDAEVLSVRDDDRPHAFQDTMSRFGRDAGPVASPTGDPLEQAGPGGDTAPGIALRPFFFDLLHVDGQDLIDEPLGTRLAALDEVGHPHRIPGIVTADAAEAQAFLDRAMAAGHEGVMVKALDSPYQAGRRGKAWRKVKPVRLFDLVVLGAEWGHGRRTGWLSNLHLGARDPAAGGFTMVGKTFKGMTDELLTWQTAALLEREVAREGIVVHVRPELVVEIALDGVQTSTRYKGGVALRFARVRRYRPDKAPADADTIDALRALLVR